LGEKSNSFLCSEAFCVESKTHL